MLSHKYIGVVALFLLWTTMGLSQKVSLRNNLLYDATLLPNVGFESHFDSFWSLGLNGGLHGVYNHYNVRNVSFPFGTSVKDGRMQGDLVAVGGSADREKTK